MSDKDKRRCPKCLGAGEVHNGLITIPCMECMSQPPEPPTRCTTEGFGCSKASGIHMTGCPANLPSACNAGDDCYDRNPRPHDPERDDWVDKPTDQPPTDCPQHADPNCKFCVEYAVDSVRPNQPPASVERLALEALDQLDADDYGVCTDTVNKVRRALKAAGHEVIGVWADD